MSFLQAYKMAIKSILGNKVRSFLTMLGVIIGVSAVIAAVAFAQGTTKSMTERIQSLGTNLVQISITGRNSNRNVTYQGLKDFSTKNSDQIAYLAPVINSSMTMKNGTVSESTSVIGTTSEYEYIKSRGVSSGRFILSLDSDYRQKVAVIGSYVAKTLFEGVDPIGKGILLNGNLFQVVGVLDEAALSADQSDDDVVIIPVTVAQRIMQSAVIRNFIVQAATPDDVSSVMEKLNVYLLEIYRNASSFRVFNQAQILSTLESTTSMMMMVLGGIATISLIVGGIGIMNIMLVSVTERTKEIGIRKAIGAKKKNILIQFLIEALMVTGIGGLIGVAIGLSVIKFILGGMKIVPEVYSLPWILISFGVSLVVGVVFGIFPAYKAANLNPIEALRAE